MSKSIFTILMMVVSLSFAQDKEDVKAMKRANNYVYEGNTLLADKEDFVLAEMAYRKAISQQPKTTAGLYNLGNSYYNSKNHEEALYRLEQAAKIATSKDEKHKAFHNIGNVLMKAKRCKEAVEAYKSALRNNPSDDETRYNLALAKQCAEQQKDQGDDNQSKGDKEEKDNKEDSKDQDDKDNNEGDDKEDEEGKPKDDKDNKGQGEDEKENQQQPKPQPGQLSPQQIKNLLEAMNNQEQKVQEKVNADKQKGVKVKTDKDW